MELSNSRHGGYCDDDDESSGDNQDTSHHPKIASNYNRQAAQFLGSVLHQGQALLVHSSSNTTSSSSEGRCAPAAAATVGAVATSQPSTGAPKRKMAVRCDDYLKRDVSAPATAGAGAGAPEGVSAGAVAAAHMAMMMYDADVQLGADGGVLTDEGGGNTNGTNKTGSNSRYRAPRWVAMAGLLCTAYCTCVLLYCTGQRIVG